MNSSNDFEIEHPWYNKNSNQLCAGSSVICEAGSLVVLDYRVDNSRHDGTPLHMNAGVRVGPSGDTLTNQTSFLKKCDKKIKTEFHYQEL